VITVLKNFYQKYLSDPQAAILAILIVGGFSIIILMGGMLLPVFASIVIAYLLDDLVVKLKRSGIRRRYGVWIAYLLFIAALLALLFGLIPLLTTQITALIRELPQMIASGQKALEAIPQNYPALSEQQLAEAMRSLQQQITGFGQRVVAFSLHRIPGLITFTVYLVLMPLLVFFFLKDKWQILIWGNRFLPKERDLMTKVWTEMDHQLGNYVRGKVWEAIIVGVISGATFTLMGMNYSILLGVAVGLSVIIPYIGAVVVTIPVLLIAYFQWGVSADFAYAMIAYGVIQTLDGVILVPLLFSGAVNIHPVAIIVSVLLFGGLWGFWGVFFAIPLATFVRALITAWPRTQTD
jgi:putative permease